MNKRGFIGKPLVRDVNDPRSQIWTGQFSDGTWVVGLFNREDTPQTRSIDFEEDLGLSGEYLVSDMWSHSLLGSMSSYSEEIEPHGVRLLKISKLMVEPSGGFFTGPETITLHSFDPDAEIRYTTDGTEPTADSTLYDEPFVLEEPGTVRAKIITGDGQEYEAYATFVENSTTPVAELAASIETIPSPEKGALLLELPTVPGDYTIRIKSSDNTNVIGTSGIITPPSEDTTVNLVLEITDLSNGMRADTDMIPVVVPGSDGNYFTRTYGPVQATLYGNAALANCSLCQTGRKVRNVGNGPDNYVLYDVNVPVKGTYHLQIEYMTGGTRSLFASVNDGDGTELELSGLDFNTPRYTVLTVDLQAGRNTIKLYNDTSHTPDLGSIVLGSTGPVPDDWFMDSYHPSEAALSGNTRLSNCSLCSTGVKIGHLGNGADNYAVFENVNVPGSGVYELEFEYFTGNQRSLFVSVNGDDGMQLDLDGPDFNTAQIETITVYLNKGDNMIKFYNDTDWAPDVGEIVISSIPLRLDLNKTEIWPPNKKMVDIHAELEYGGNMSDIDSVELTSITSNEPDDGYVEDAEFGTEDMDFKLRAWRSPYGNGRVYTIVYTITLISGHETTATATVKVPHDQRQEEPK